MTAFLCQFVRCAPSTSPVVVVVVVVVITLTVVSKVMVRAVVVVGVAVVGTIVTQWNLSILDSATLQLIGQMLSSMSIFGYQSHHDHHHHHHQSSSIIIPTTITK